MVESKQSGKGELNKAMEKLDHEVRNGLKHGFFEYTINCEVTTGHKRTLTIKAGKSHRFTIGEDELQD